MKSFYALARTIVLVIITTCFAGCGGDEVEPPKNSIRQYDIPDRLRATEHEVLEALAKKGYEHVDPHTTPKGTREWKLKKANALLTIAFVGPEDALRSIIVFAMSHDGNDEVNWEAVVVAVSTAAGERTENLQSTLVGMRNEARGFSAFKHHLDYIQRVAACDLHGILIGAHCNETSTGFWVSRQDAF